MILQFYSSNRYRNETVNQFLVFYQLLVIFLAMAMAMAMLWLCYGYCHALASGLRLGISCLAWASWAENDFLHCCPSIIYNWAFLQIQHGCLPYPRWMPPPARCCLICSAELRHCPLDSTGGGGGLNFFPCLGEPPGCLHKADLTGNTRLPWQVN